MTAVIVVTYGRVDLTKRTIDTLLSTGFGLSEGTITIVDNGSQAEMVTLLTSYRDQIDNLVLLRENRGKPYALNLGAKVASERCVASGLEPPSHFLFCDNDLDFKEGWNDTMVATYEEHKDLPLCALSGMRWPSHKLDGLVKGENPVNIVRFPPGCCLMLSADAFHTNGPWDTRRLIRTVDTCYHRNSHRRGSKNGSVHPVSVIEHTGRKDRSWHIQTGKPKLLP